MPQIPTLVGEAVLRAGRMVRVGHSLEDAVVDEAVQPPGEDVARDPKAGLEVIETGHAQEGVPDDEQTPPFPDDLETLGDRAVQVLEAGSLHNFIV
jgi:hypothetical protein